MSESKDREKMKGWETLGPRSKNEDIRLVGKALNAIGEAELSGATVDVDHMRGAGERGRAEGIDETGRRIIVEKAPVDRLVAASEEREDWKAKGSPSKVKLFLRRLAEQVPFIARLLKPMRRRPKTRYEYEQRHDGYKRIHKL